MWETPDHSEAKDSTRPSSAPGAARVFSCRFRQEEGLLYFFLTAGCFKMNYSVLHLTREEILALLATY